MATAARDRLARTLRGDAQTAFSVELTSRMDDLNLEVELPAGGCTCELCHTLRAFLEDKTRRSFEWPLAKQRRQHVHSRIDAAELPVTHKTMRHGSPYTLVLNKTDALFTREQEARIRDETDLEWLAAQ